MIPHNYKFKILVVLVVGFSSTSFAFPGSGLAAAGKTSAGGGCEGTDPGVAKWCPMIREILNDKNSCGGKVAAELASKQIPNADQMCPELNTNSNKVEVLAALAGSLMKYESHGDPNTKGDNGKSLGLLQITPGDDFEPCPKSMDPFDPKQNLECGLCEAFEPVIKANTLIGEKKGISQQFGPARDTHKEHPALLETARQACASAPQGGSGSEPLMVNSSQSAPSATAAVYRPSPFSQQGVFTRPVQVRKGRW